MRPSGGSPKKANATRRLTRCVLLGPLPRFTLRYPPPVLGATEYVPSSLITDAALAADFVIRVSLYLFPFL